MLHFVLERARPLSDHDHVFFPRLYNLRRHQLRRTDGNPSAGSERLTPPEKVHNAVQSDQRSRRTLDIADHQLLACAYDELQEEHQMTRSRANPAKSSPLLLCMISAAGVSGKRTSRSSKRY